MWNNHVYEIDEKLEEDDKYFDEKDLNIRQLLSKPLKIEKASTTFSIIVGCALFKIGRIKSSEFMINLASLLLIYLIITMVISIIKCISKSIKLFLVKHDETDNSKKLIYNKEIYKRWFNTILNSINGLSAYSYCIGIEDAFYVLIVGIFISIIRKLISIGILKTRLAMVSAELEEMMSEVNADNYETYNLFGDFALKDKESREMEVMYGIGNMCMVYEFKKLINQIKVLSVEERENHHNKVNLITNLSHDLKTPLTSIYNSVYILKTENLKEDEKSIQIDIIERKLDRLKKLTKNLDEIIDNEYSNIYINKEKINILDLLYQSIDNHRVEIDAKHLDIRISNPKNTDVYIDIDKTKRIFDNILSNISKYTLENSRVYINLIEDDDEKEYKIEFKNISKYEMDVKKELIGERFVKGDKSRNIEGHGLGVNIIKHLMRVQGGKCELLIQGDLFKTILVFDS